MQYDQPRAELSHQADMMIDDANADSELMGAPKQKRELDAFSFVKPRRWLIKQELRRAPAERDGDAEAPEIAERHNARDFVGEPLQANKLQKLLRRRPSRPSAVFLP